MPWKLASTVIKAGLGVIALAAAVGVYAVLVATRPTPDTRPVERTRPTVGVVTAAARDVSETWVGYGTARAMDAADIASEIAARVTRRPERVEAGNPIAEGELIVRLDDADVRERAAALEQTIAALTADTAALEVEEANLDEQVAALAEQLAIAERDLGRIRAATESRATNESQVDDARLAVEQARRSLLVQRQLLELIPPRRAALRARIAAERANLRQAQTDLARAEIRAPFDAVLASVAAERGEYLRVGDAVASLVDLSRIEVPLRIAASAAGRVRPGDRATLTPDGPANGLGRVWSGSVARVSPEIDAATRTLTVFVEVRQDPAADTAGGLAPAAPLLRPGTFLRGEIVGSSTTRRVVVPRRVVQDELVFIAEPAAPETQTETDADAPARVRRVAVAVDRYIDASFPDIAPDETQWAVVSLDPAAAATAALAEGDLVLVTNLDTARPDQLVNVAPVTAPPGERVTGRASPGPESGG